jgi:serine/threonine-protein kinase
MAPEQIGGDIDPRADVFAVGVMVWEAVVGHRMWHKKGDVEVLTNIIKGLTPTLKEAKPDAPEQLIRICDRALAKNREDRYATAADFQADLEAYLVSSMTDIKSRDVGKVIGELFATERTTTRNTIEQHIASLKAGKRVEKLPSLRPAALESSTPSGAKVGSMRLADPPSFTPASLQSIVTGPTPGGTQMPSGASDALTKERVPKKQKATIGIAVGAAAFVLVGILALRAGSKSVAVPGPTATQAASAPAPEAAPGPTAHEVALRVIPPNAIISIEGVPLSNPGKRTCVHGQRVIMHASAAHFVSTDRELACERDESIELSLQPEPTAAMPTPPAATFVATPWVPTGRKSPAPPPPPVAASRVAVETAAPPAAPPAAPTPPTGPAQVSPTGGSRPNRAIDTANPYGNQ